MAFKKFPEPSVMSRIACFVRPKPKDNATGM